MHRVLAKLGWTAQYEKKNSNTPDNVVHETTREKTANLTMLERERDHPGDGCSVRIGQDERIPHAEQSRPWPT